MDTGTWGVGYFSMVGEGEWDKREVKWIGKNILVIKLVKKDWARSQGKGNIKNNSK